MKKVDFGRKYEFKVDSNPRVGYYEVDTALNQTKTRSKAAKIMTKTSTYKRPDEHSPEPGQYDGAVKNFGSETKKFTIGGKYIHKYDPNLGPGYYEGAKAQKSTLSRSQSAVIREPQFKGRPAEPGPEADTKHIKSFGEGMNKVDFGRKYEFKVDGNPPPTRYNPDNRL